MLEIDELDDVLTERTNPSRVLDQLRLSDIWDRLPKIRERSSEAMPMSLSVHVRVPPPFAPMLPESTPVQGGDKTSHWNASEVLSVAE